MKSVAELEAIREKLRIEKGYSVAVNENDIKVAVGMGTCGIAAGAREVVRTFMEEVEKNALENVKVIPLGSLSGDGDPVVEVTLPGKQTVTYKHVNPDKVREIVTSHIIGGNPVNNK